MEKWVERKDYNKVITVKLVIPGSCNASCVFCYMKGYKDIMVKNDDSFRENFIKSLDYILGAIGNKNKVSLDITGNEPTLHPELLVYVLTELKHYEIQKKVERVTITTNGVNLIKVAKYMPGVINYVNISIHDYHLARKYDIMRTETISLDNLYDSIQFLSNVNITCSAIAVIYKPIDDFRKWCDEFIDWAKFMGFIALRLRCDVFWKDKYIFDHYMDMYLADPDFTVINHENTPDSHWARLRRNDKFRLFFLKGVEDTSLVNKGIEYIIADDGKLYCDYFKRMPIDEYPFEIGKIYDKEVSDDAMAE